MNGRTSKLLRSLAVATNRTLPEVKREWHSTPRNKRGDVRSGMFAGLWANELKLWRRRNGNMLQKNAWDYLGVGENTYKSWESARNTPNKYAMIALRQAMKEYDRNHQIE